MTPRSIRVKLIISQVLLNVPQDSLYNVSSDTSPDYVITYNYGVCTLRFEEVILDDAAEYTCKANNQLGAAQCSTRFTVQCK